MCPCIQEPNWARYHGRTGDSSDHQLLPEAPAWPTGRLTPAQEVTNAELSLSMHRGYQERADSPDAEIWTRRWPGQEHTRRRWGVPEPEAGASLTRWRDCKNTSLFRATGTLPPHRKARTGSVLPSPAPTYYCDMKETQPTEDPPGTPASGSLWWVVISKSTSSPWFFQFHS